MAKGKVVKEFGAFQVTDDGAEGSRYGVWQITANKDPKYIAGATKANAMMVAEALHKASLLADLVLYATK